MFRLLRKQCFPFDLAFYSRKHSFTIYSNQHQRSIEFINGKKEIYDQNTLDYALSEQAFLEKRWTTKEELRNGL